MNFQPAKQELILVLMAIFMGVLLRTSHTDRLAVEHFDEGVYSSTIWYNGQDGAPYPMLHLYAPPLLPMLIATVAAIPGLQDIAPFAPSLLFGSLTILVLWWTARSWFGLNAGIVIAFVAAFSDFHILFSRMALTDVPALFWICLAVATASRGLQTRSLRTMAVAGVFTGFAWWTKYTGWLALAIIVSGSWFWWVIKGRKEVGFAKLLTLQLAMIVTAFVVWSPVLWMLQQHGGYAAVAKNHSGYFLGLTGWQQRLADHMVYHFRLDSWFSACALGIGMLAAGTQRWFLLVRSTWNDRQTSTSSDAPSAFDRFPLRALLARFIIAAAAIGVLASGPGTIGILTCIGIAGIAGMFLWPTLAHFYDRRMSGDCSAPTPEALPYTREELAAAPSIDPILGLSLVSAWFAGMLLMTPMYYPYPRLSLTLLAATWLAAAGSLAWWFEATVNVVRRGGETEGGKVKSFGKRVVPRLLLMFALLLILFGAGSYQSSWIWQDRTSLRDASLAIGEAMLQEVEGTYVPAAPPAHMDESGILHPDAEDEYDDEGRPIPQPTMMEELSQLLAEKRDASEPLVDADTPTMVVYAMGEPAVLSHLARAGFHAAPVADVNIQSATLDGEALPTYLILGPNALRTDGLLASWMEAQHRFDYIDDFYFAPSEIVIFNLFNPKWISQHEEVGIQKLELYRLK